jgi:hypothetical protein
VALTIDSSENVLANTTSTSVIGNGGFAIKPQTGNGTRVDISNDGEAMLLDGAASGPIIGLYGNGTSVGNIGVNSGDQVYFAASDGMGIKVDTDNTSVEASNASGADNDNAVNLGSSGTRWKDLYLSGGVYLGGTAAANKLDDYEEGTFTPTVTVGTLGDAAGAYTKIGDTVIVYMYMGAFSNRSSGSILTINNLPFTSANGLANGAGGSIFSRYCNKLPNATYVSNNSTNVEMYESATGNYDTVKHDDLSSVSAYFFIQIIYKTS